MAIGKKYPWEWDETDYQRTLSGAAPLRIPWYRQEVTAEEEDEYREPLDEEPGDTFVLLDIGDKVTTPDGEGEVTNIALHGAEYGEDHFELEPPAITVKLDSGEEVVVCPCVIELEDADATELLHSEYERLWPPVEELPGDAQRLVDDEKIEDNMQNQRAYLDKRFLRAYKWATHVVTAEGPLTPGMVLEELEGVDIGEGAVVVEVDLVGTTQKVKLYLPDTEDTKTVKIPLDSTHRALDIPEKEPIPDTVYDESVLESGDPEGAIRWVPDSYLPKNPNYPSSLSDALWRPTYRQYPRYPGGTWASVVRETWRKRAINDDDAKHAFESGDFVTFRGDGSEYIGTIFEFGEDGVATVDVVGYRNDSNSKWQLKVMGLEQVPVEDLTVARTSTPTLPKPRGASMMMKRTKKQADYGYDYDPNSQDDPYYTEPDWVDFPIITEQDVVEEDWDPDLQPSPERLYENPIALFDPDKSPKKQYEQASHLWEEYQTYRHKKVPGVTWSHENMPFEYYCFIFAQDHGLSLEQMDELWDYMESIGFMTMRQRRQWDEAKKQDEILYRLKLYRNGRY